VAGEDEQTGARLGNRRRDLLGVGFARYNVPRRDPATDASRLEGDAKCIRYADVNVRVANEDVVRASPARQR
jgi:hypothetical protein